MPAKKQNVNAPEVSPPWSVVSQSCVGPQGTVAPSGGAPGGPSGADPAADILNAIRTLESQNMNTSPVITLNAQSFRMFGGPPASSSSGAALPIAQGAPLPI